jgi:hypothetical protein
MLCIVNNTHINILRERCAKRTLFTGYLKFWRLSKTFSSPNDVHIIIHVIKSYKPVTYLNVIMFFYFHVVKLLHITDLLITLFIVHLLTGIHIRNLAATKNVQYHKSTTVKDRTSSEWMLCKYQDTIIMTVCLSIRRNPSAFTCLCILLRGKQYTHSYMFWSRKL